MWDSASICQEVRQAAKRFGDWCAQIEHAAQMVFGHHPTQEAIRRLCQQRLQESERLAAQGDLPAIALLVVGPVGAGKGWLARCFLQDAQLRQRIPSGQSDRHRSTQLIWLGLSPPTALGPGEQFLAVPADKMLDLGAPYILGDAPGFTSAHPIESQLSQRALTSAAIKLLVLQQEHLRDRHLAELIRSLPGAYIVPVIRFRGAPHQPQPAASLREDVQYYYQRWQQQAPAAQLLPALFIPDADHYAPHAPEQTIALVQNLLQQTLTPLLQQPLTLQRGRIREIHARYHLLLRDLDPYLVELRTRLQPILDDIHSDLYNLIPRLAQQISGQDHQLRLTIRIQLRALWLQATPLWCFPYRTILGLLILTTNAWDRLIWSALGSIPSLVAVVWQSVVNLSQQRRVRQRQQINIAAQLQQEARALLSGRLQQLRRTLHQFRAADTSPSQAAPDDPPAVAVRLIGLDEFQNRCRRIVHQSISEQVARSWAPLLFALVGTALFATLFAGPVLTIYRQYLHITTRAFSGEAVSWHDFPQPSLTMIVTSFLLSALPVVLTAMVALTWACRRSWIDTIAQRIRDQVAALVQQWQNQAQLRWEWEEPHVQAVQKLLGIGTAHIPAIDPAQPVSGSTATSPGVGIVAPVAPTSASRSTASPGCASDAS
jgi:hypothetical protein